MDFVDENWVAGPVRLRVWPSACCQRGRGRSPGRPQRERGRLGDPPELSPSLWPAYGRGRSPSCPPSITPRREPLPGLAREHGPRRLADRGNSFTREGRPPCRLIFLLVMGTRTISRTARRPSLP